MVRDPELVRTILCAVEASEDGLGQLHLDGYTERQVAYHIQILIEAGLLVGTVQFANNKVYAWYVTRLTWEGHEFLAAARNETAWKRTMMTMEKLGGFVFSIAKPLLIEFIKEQLLPGV